MKHITIQANYKYTITQQSDGEVIVFRNGKRMIISDSDIIISLASIIESLQKKLEIYKNLDSYA